MQSLMSSSVEWQNGPSRADLAILTFARSPTAQARKNKFSILVQWAPIVNFCKKFDYCGFTATILMGAV